MISSTDLRAIPWSFLLGYVIPLLAMAVPTTSTKRIRTKHVIAEVLSSHYKMERGGDVAKGMERARWQIKREALSHHGKTLHLPQSFSLHSLTLSHASVVTEHPHATLSLQLGTVCLPKVAALKRPQCRHHQQRMLC